MELCNVFLVYGRPVEQREASGPTWSVGFEFSNLANNLASTLTRMMWSLIIDSTHNLTRWMWGLVVDPAHHLARWMWGLVVDSGHIHAIWLRALVVDSTLVSFCSCLRQHYKLPKIFCGQDWGGARRWIEKPASKVGPWSLRIVLFCALRDCVWPSLLESLLDNWRLVRRDALKLDCSHTSSVTGVVAASEAVERSIERHVSAQRFLLGSLHLQRRFTACRKSPPRGGLVLIPTARPATRS
jgi:hypothetical protein